MTNDELLAIVKEESNFDSSANSRALLAVVELHKPIRVPHNDYDTEYGCSSPSCADKYDEPGPYPCPTIQAIEKELG